MSHKDSKESAFSEDSKQNLQDKENVKRDNIHLMMEVEDKTSELRSVIELLQDEILERRKTEEALRQSEQQYRGLFNYMSSGVAVLESSGNGTDFIFRDFNHAGEQIDGLTKEDIIGEKVTKVFPGIRECGLFDVFQRVWKTGKPEHHPVTLYSDDRISGWKKTYVYKLPSGDIAAVYDNVTEQVQATERESELLRELKNIFDNFPVGIVYLNKDYKIISTNRFFNEFAGFREGELAGELCYESVGEFSANSERTGIEKVCTFCKKNECQQSKKPTSIERPLNDKFVRVTTIPEFDEEGNISRFMEIIEDITERKHAQAEVMRSSHLAALGELAAGVAHEINNPINGIINYTQILLNKGERGSKEHEIAGRIIKEGDRIAGIVSNLLSFARDRKEEKTRINLRDVLSDSLALTETQIIKDGIKLNVYFPSSLPEIIAQPQQLEQVFLNVISNARYALNEKYPGNHEDKIFEIRGGETETGSGTGISILFHDHGLGIPANIQDKIMNPFFSTKPSGIGTGLGLSISHGIVTDHGGKLSIDSTEGEFTKVIIELPVMI